jgi:hypothetical protein
MSFFVKLLSFVVILCLASCRNNEMRLPITPSANELQATFGNADEKKFLAPPRVYHPETWFHFIDDNVKKAGITADLEAIAAAGISGVQLFHGHLSHRWPGIDSSLVCLSPRWEEHVRFVADECRRLGLRFTMQNCPGWAMAGGPWIKSENAMRQLVVSRTDIKPGDADIVLPRPQPSEDDWRDYRDIAVVAFPTPAGDTGETLQPAAVSSDVPFAWKDMLAGKDVGSIKLPPAEENRPHVITATFSHPVTARTIEFSSVNGFAHIWCYEPGIEITVEAIGVGGIAQTTLATTVPQANWQDYRPLSLALDETSAASQYRITIANRHEMNISMLRLTEAARKNNWEAEAGWTLRSLMRSGQHPRQSPEAFVTSNQIIDLTQKMAADGRLTWQPPAGRWTVLRFGHVNQGQQNAPATKEGTGWECDKLSAAGPEAHFAGYIGRLVDGPLVGRLLDGMLLDSWECSTQTWTDSLETVFDEQNGYPLRKWLPAVFGYVVDDHETSARFLLDWRRTIGYLFANRFFGTMANLAKQKGLNIQYETAAGDIFPADILEYYKYADVPMAEFWQPHGDYYVGSINFKPIKPTVSAARMYGKPRVAAEAFTSFELTFDEHLSMLREVANLNMIEGITHLIFHTYTHNPVPNWLPPGSSMGTNIGTPFLRGQTWWHAMPEFTTCLARLNYMLERGYPVSDVLWYLGDEINHKPDQKIEIAGYKYDYCNFDVLLNRLTVADGKILTPEGLSYRLLWLPDNVRMLPETLERMAELSAQGAVIVGERPEGLATLKDDSASQKRFDRAADALWGANGKAIAGKTIKTVLQSLDIQPDVAPTEALWLHRKIEGADWYFVSAPFGSGFNGVVNFRCVGTVEIWDPVSGEIIPADVVSTDDGRTTVNLSLERAGSCFVVFRHDKKTSNQKLQIKNQTSKIDLGSNVWTIYFPSGWGTPDSLLITELQPWNKLDMIDEGRSFSGTVEYHTGFDVPSAADLKSSKVVLDLGRVEMLATVTINGHRLRTLWTPPYSIDITRHLRKGKNRLQIDVTSTWYNRLAFDARQAEVVRKTWTIGGPKRDAKLRESGLLGPVEIKIFEK